MNIYSLTRDDDNQPYESYIGAVVIAESEEAARLIHPGKLPWDEAQNSWIVEVGGLPQNDLWVDPKDVIVKLLGTAIAGSEPGVVMIDWYE